ncbi:hypothetical protein CFIO01_09258 [Colletotrichum fioriniae PJ7]|uniref:Intradiol ring-cleavage dioxygenases domain-containing protein n=1 Tax=Colletotrichum fioriniae PJ7 TaxID=1445577 RepID=A0A010R064_9PEZI|nr:hypothetical protein CFIO01_09258 [Colletotrichum fioriniae PJ7]
MVGLLTSITLFAVLLVNGTAAHPGDHHPDISHLERERAFHRRTAQSGAVKMSRCADTLGTVRKSAIQRRTTTWERLRQERGFVSPAGIQGRNKEEVAYYDSLNHNLTSVVKSGSYEELFGSNASCVLGRAETIGPYYVESELLRSNITEDQIGIPMHMELQFVDVNTCKPVPAFFIDIWGANATGGYSGAESPAGISGFGGLNSTFLRGIQITDEHGVASFDLIVPGHYYPRATHTHIVAWGNATTFANGTIAGGLATDDTFIRYVGQLYYEQKLRDAVDPIWPYNTNTDKDNFKNVDDYILAENKTLNGNTVGDLGAYDPFVKYAYLTNDLADGIFTWHTIGVDMGDNFNGGFQAAAKYEEDGGRALNAWGDGSINPYPAVVPPKGIVSTTAASSRATGL